MRIMYGIGCLLFLTGISIQTYRALNGYIKFETNQVEVGEKIMITGALICLLVILIALPGILFGFV
ncbi:MAG: hypothetical protein UT05_C0004G0043 [Parcubacteria group bacterium GW2011_GWF2_38_76]|nr:MAG: hypothetical protein UT05_C0004G0043 [Parcubacteria group bacterium GW2011_GWF2_38_76]